MNEGHSQFADLLMNSEGNLYSLLSMFKDTLIFLFDSQGRFTFGHTDTKAHLHADPDRFLGKTVDETMPANLVEPFRHALEKNRNGEVAEFDYWMDMVTHTGWFSATCSPIFRDGVFEGTMAIVRDITEKKTAADALKTSEENFRTLVEMAAMGIIIISDAKIVYSNPVASEISGFTPDELIGQNFLDFIAPSERERVFKIHTDRMNGEDSPELYELRMLIKSGKMIDVEVSARVIEYLGRRSVQVLMQDITARKLAEKDIIQVQENLQEKIEGRTRELERYREHLEEIVQERTSRLRDTVNLLRTEIEERMMAEERIEHLNLILRAIRNISLLITNETDPQRLIDGACRSLVETRGYQTAWIQLQPSDGSTMTAHMGKHGENINELMTHLAEGKSTACLTKSLQTRGSWISAEHNNICEDCPFPAGDSSNSRLMACRLESHERIYGVLAVRVSGSIPPDEEEVTLFTELCNDIAFALDSIEQETAWRQATRALADSQDRYEALFENASASIMILDKQQVIECNTKCAEIFSTTKELMAGKSLSDLSPEKQPDGTISKTVAESLLERARNEGPVFFKWIHKRQNGEEFPAEIGLNSIVLSGNTYTQAVITDITCREKAEEALRASEQNYRTLYTNVPIGLFRSDASSKGKFQQVNPATGLMFGYESPDELMKTSLVNLFANRSDAGKFDKELAEKGILRDFTARMKRADGSEFWASLSARLSSESNTTDLYIDGIVTDISHTIQYETNLRESVERLERAIDGTVSAMSLLVEMKDPYTSGHQKGVAHLAAALAEEMNLDQEEIDCVRIASKLHDLGKLSIPTEILSKPGPLSEYEIEYLKTHPRTGYNILKSIDFPWPIAKVILQHHERLDGSGYPDGISGDDILPGARILAVADVVEATASRRPYRASKGIEAALDIIEEGIGVAFDRQVVKACLTLFREKGFKLLDHDRQTIGADFIL